MTASTDPTGPGPITRAIARLGRRAVGVALLALAIGLSTCQALTAVDPDATAPVLEKLQEVTGAHVSAPLSAPTGGAH